MRRWSEFENVEGNEPVWRISAERVKMKREHIVPLAPQAVALLRELRALPGSEANPFLFPSPSREGYMSNNTMLYALYRMGYHGRATVHGFRAMASTALNEMGFRPDVIERQLAHEERNTVRAAYNRAEYLSERREMMNLWCDYVDALREGGGRVAPMRRLGERNFVPQLFERAPEKQPVHPVVVDYQEVANLRVIRRGHVGALPACARRSRTRSRDG
jgi:hypothetical protein